MRKRKRKEGTSAIQYTSVVIISTLAIAIIDYGSKDILGRAYLGYVIGVLTGMYLMNVLRKEVQGDKDV